MRNYDEFLERIELGKKSSLLYWYPIIKKLDIPQIKTEIVNTGHKVLSDWIRKDVPLPVDVIIKLHDAMEKIGNYPMFMRTDQASGKHSWNSTCFIPNKDSMIDHLYAFIEEHQMMSMAGELGYEAVVFREFLDLEHYFTVFYHEFPVSKEVRCFIKNGKLQSIHNYWFEDAIEQGHPHDIKWREKLEKINTITESDKLEIKSQLEKVLPKFNDYWSVDFAKGRNGIWRLIDMARGEVSYHPENIVEKIGGD